MADGFKYVLMQAKTLRVSPCLLYLSTYTIEYICKIRMRGGLLPSFHTS